MKQLKKKYGWTGKHLSLLVLAVFLLFFQGMGLFAGTEYRMQDFHYQKGGLVSPEIYVIGIDEETLMAYGTWPSWGREKLAELIRLLNQNEETAPAVIGFDIGFFGAYDEEDDRALADAASKLDNVVVTSYASFGKQVTEGTDGSFSVQESVVTYETPYEELSKWVSWGFSNVPLDEDGIVRHSLYQVPADGQTEYSFAAEVYRKYMGDLPEAVREGAGSGYIPFSGMPYDYYGSASSGLSLCQVLEGEIPAELFAGSIVLVGPYSSGMMDAYYTAVSHNVPMYGVEVHANILQAFLDDNQKTELPRAAALVVTAVMLAAAAGSWAFHNIKLAVALNAALAGAWWLCSGRLYEQGYVLPLLYPLAAVALCFICQIGWQYVRERLAKKHVEAVFGRYVSSSVVNGIIKGGEEALKLGGQKKDIAVLFVDIRGFTPLSEALPPEKVVEILNRYLELTTEAVFANGGTVDKFIGDATMAVYNAPLDLDDYVYKAVKTGLDMAEAARKMEKELLEITDKKVGFGIGINCGEAVIGNIGTAKRMEYTAIGSTVNTASRLEGRAAAGEVLISSEVYERLKGRIEATSLGLCSLKGISGEVEIFRVEKRTDQS